MGDAGYNLDRAWRFHVDAAILDDRFYLFVCCNAFRYGNVHCCQSFSRVDYGANNYKKPV